MGLRTGSKFIFPAKILSDSISKGLKVGFRGIFGSERVGQFNVLGNQGQIKRHSKKGFLLRKRKKCIFN